MSPGITANVRRMSDSVQTQYLLGYSRLSGCMHKDLISNMYQNYRTQTRILVLDGLHTYDACGINRPFQSMHD